MPEDRLVSITSSSHLVPDDVARHTFGTVRRGFDPGEVRAYLESIAMGLRSVNERENELLQSLADAEHRAAHPVLDEATLTDAVGTETARVLRSAHEVAAEVEGKANAEADRILSEARTEAEESRARAEATAAELTEVARTAAEGMRERTSQQVAAGLEAARSEADQLVSTAREECRAMVEEAQELRSRVLADLGKRRKVLHAQIEQLRAGRERLTETVNDVRRSVEAIAADLFSAEDNARVAAETAGRAAAARPDEGTPEEMASLLLAEEAEAGGGEGKPSDGRAAEQATDSDAGPTPDAVADPSSEHPTPPGGTQTIAEEDLTPVDELFARIRAEREDTGGGTEPTVPDARPETSPETGGGAGGTESDSAASSGESSEVAADAGGTEDRPPDDRPPAAVQRDQLIEPIVSSLARRLKRLLQDSQNDLLDNLRSHGATWSTALLPEQVEQVDTFATAALPTLEEAVEAGVSFAANGDGEGPRGDVLVGIAHELAEAVVGPLRRRLADDHAGLADGDEAAAVEHVGSAFREWKGERIERLAGDHVIAAFSAGTMAVVEAGPGQLEWMAVTESGDAPCPDCEDNGLSGSQRPGEKFPTGHLRPPAHPGCRCLLARSAT